jgi:hypothetical protein
VAVAWRSLEACPTPALAPFLAPMHPNTLSHDYGVIHTHTRISGHTISHHPAGLTASDSFLPCYPPPQLVTVQFWADPLIWGYDHRAADASECCASCHAYNAAVERGGTAQGRNASRCNTWAFCANREVCKGRWGECW